MKIDKQQLEILSYKLLHDALFLWTLVFTAFLIVEAILPGYFTAHIGFGKLIAAFFAIGIPAAHLGKRHNFNSKNISVKDFFKRKITLFLLPLFIILIVLSLWKFEKPEIAIITATALAIFYYLMKVFFEE